MAENSYVKILTQNINVQSFNINEKTIYTGFVGIVTFLAKCTKNCK